MVWGQRSSKRRVNILDGRESFSWCLASPHDLVPALQSRPAARMPGPIDPKFTVTNARKMPRTTESQPKTGQALLSQLAIPEMLLERNSPGN